VGLYGRRFLKFILKEYGVGSIQNVKDSCQWDGFFENRDEHSCSISEEDLDHVSN
jgi:hypothetical protein